MSHYHPLYDGEDRSSEAGHAVKVAATHRASHDEMVTTPRMLRPDNARDPAGCNVRLKSKIFKIVACVSVLTSIVAS